MWRWRYIVVLIGLVICFSPGLGVLWSGWFADRHDCVLHEGFSNPCIVDGEDWGETLYSAFVLGWLMLATLPLAAVLTLILIAMIGFDLIRKWVRR
ncbi:hypothetical protein [Thalassovita sp.]|uniref:hypothetical protein n=1 Tax=Thalassovita sp. TaxID=1979401 RepID=UPI002B27BA8A|nr:hypothetical protein [Thalassovita sp.]